MNAPTGAWSRLSLGDGVIAIGACADIEARFRQVTSSVNSDANIAVFKRHDFENSLQCEVIVFFSPAAYELGMQFNAARCARPSRDNLELLAGDEKCWPLLFGSNANHQL